MTASFERLLVLGILTAVLALTVRKQNPEQAMLLSVLGCALAGIVLISWIEPVLDLIRVLGDRAGLDPDLIVPLLKILGIGLVSQIAASVCADAGQTALSKLLELGGGLVCLCLSLPLLESVLALIEELL